MLACALLFGAWFRETVGVATGEALLFFLCLAPFLLLSPLPVLPDCPCLPGDEPGLRTPAEDLLLFELSDCFVRIPIRFRGVGGMDGLLLNDRKSKRRKSNPPYEGRRNTNELLRHVPEQAAPALTLAHLSPHKQSLESEQRPTPHQILAHRPEHAPCAGLNPTHIRPTSVQSVSNEQGRRDRLLTREQSEDGGNTGRRLGLRVGRAIGVVGTSRLGTEVGRINVGDDG